MHRAVAYEPPSEELSEALIVLARYVTTTEHPGSREEPFRPAQVRAWLPVPPAQPALSYLVPRRQLRARQPGPCGGTCSTGMCTHPRQSPEWLHCFQRHKCMMQIDVIA